MLDKIMKKFSEENSFSQPELKNIRKSSTHLREILEVLEDFKVSSIAGSYERKTMVKGMSDIDIFIEYTGADNPQKALHLIKTHLDSRYPNAEIKQDKLCILVVFKKITLNITPYKIISGQIKVADDRLLEWNLITNLEKLDKKLKKLKQQNHLYVDLIKIVKIWNANYNRSLANYKIEEIICSRFLNNTNIKSDSLSSWFLEFLKSNGYKKDARKFEALKDGSFNSEKALKKAWRRFINNES